MSKYYFESWKSVVLALGVVLAQPVLAHAQSPSYASTRASNGAVPATPPSDETKSLLRHWRLEVAAAGGFAGLTDVEIQSQPHLVCAAGSPPVCTPDAANVVLMRNKSYAWQPAVSTGLVYRWLLEDPKTEQEADDKLGIGVGAHFVFVPQSAGSTRPAPALALHVGKAHMQAFIGLIFVPINDATLPGGGSTAIVPASFDPSTLVRSNAGRAASFFAGIVIGGVPVTKGTN